MFACPKKVTVASCLPVDLFHHAARRFVLDRILAEAHKPGR